MYYELQCRKDITYKSMYLFNESEINAMAAEMQADGYTTTIVVHGAEIAEPLVNNVLPFKPVSVRSAVDEAARNYKAYKVKLLKDRATRNKHITSGLVKK
jgi:hypothetical protein